jgi:ubiquinone/menaquinone biosynthesis C-methylase UbiE
MPMNHVHRKLCASAWWARQVGETLPRWLQGVELGDDVLEIGPGFGATTRVLVDRVPTLTSLEIDESSVRRLRAQFDERVEIVHGDGTAMPFPDGRFSAVVCLTMLHHVPSAQLQDRLFAEVRRVLRPRGVFGAVDSRPSLPFRLLHIGDTMVVLDPATLPNRLVSAGFASTEVRTNSRQVTFVATT